MGVLTLILEGERPVSWNKFWQQRHWSERSREKNRVALLVRAALPQAVLDGEDWPLRKSCEERPEIVITAYMARPLIDVDNLCTKVYVDALKGWVIEDDDPAHVAAVIPRVVVDRTWPRIEIKISSVFVDEMDVSDGRRGDGDDGAGGAGGVAVDCPAPAEYARGC